MKWRNTYISDFIALIFPELCQACNQNLVQGEKLICTACTYDLPYTNFHLHKENVVARQFWGRIDVSMVYVLLYFSKGGKVQNLMHRFKYRNAPLIGNKLGSIAGAQLLQRKPADHIDMIVPVPLHPKKLRSRGYNQSAQFAQGLSGPMNIPVDMDNLVRVKHTDTQTKKSRFSRYENMQEVFTIRYPEKFKGKHILLVDDIITTGSTLEACGIELLKIEGVKVSLAAIAYAE
ncbi:ComF family protein [Mucilaginibacter sp. HMF5004]|uniref:ComF family protein n=1 Tax=Mucilaginibacter rivuli TaxID=2857527 RepID=UPI001C5FD3DB|nr:phosphoribosyltransferase family protein [Mucilaginibacter rivuli]MBW4891167.1 ComF family protein [Mucilaginibacter rivuli]